MRPSEVSQQVIRCFIDSILIFYCLVIDPDVHVYRCSSVVLKMTPVSIKTFIKYFANDIVGVHFGIPRHFVEANLALTAALFYRYFLKKSFKCTDSFILGVCAYNAMLLCVY